MSTSLEKASPSKIRWGQIAIWVGVLGLLAVMAFTMWRNAAGSLRVGAPVPDFTLKAYDGQTYHLAELRGKVVVINFWASWCTPCREEAPDLENTWRHYKDQGVIFLGVGYADTDKEALAYITELQVTYPNAPDLETRISSAYRITGVPETYIVDSAGRLAFSKVLPITQAELMVAIEPLLNK
jgi:cytochrome c biogenesis protein CcmG/thiol:disulfide interchange protein DsbE